jgi:hypothetical protein
MEQGVFFVDEAIESNIRLLSVEEVKNTDPVQHSPEEILYIAFLLGRKKQLPFDVVNQILDWAELWLAFENFTSDPLHGRDNMNELYLRLDIPNVRELNAPKGVILPRCRRIAVDLISRDQGWSTFETHLNQTYTGSSSWSEVMVEKITTDNQIEESPRFRICPNFRAHQRFRHHRKFFDNPEGLLQYAHLGTSIQLYIRSMYPGWTNTAVHARLRAYFTVELLEDYEFDDTVENSFQENASTPTTQPFHNRFFSSNWSMAIAVASVGFLLSWMLDI